MVAILDNSAVAMTGGQLTPSTGLTAKGKEAYKLSLEDLYRAYGADSVEVISPYTDKDANTAIIKEKLNSDGVHVIVSRVLVAGKRKKAVIKA